MIVKEFSSYLITFFSYNFYALFLIQIKTLFEKAYKNFKGIGESKFFLNKNNIGSYVKAFSTNYKPVFIKLKKLSNFWNSVVFVKSFWQKVCTKVFWGQFS